MATPSTPDTEQLLDLVARGDTQARSLLLDRHRDRLRRMITVRFDRRLLPRLDPSDLVQESLLAAEAKLSDYVRERPIAFYPWLRQHAVERLARAYEQHVRADCRSVKHEAFSVNRISAESAEQLAISLTGSDTAPDQRLIKAERISKMLAALSELPVNDREILVLRYLEELSSQEIADVLGLTYRAAQARHRRALDRLTRLVKREEMS